VKIAHDRFHIMQHATKAVDLVRRREHLRLQGEGDDRLKGKKYVWLRSQVSLTERQQHKFDASFNVELETGKPLATRKFYATYGTSTRLTKPPRTSATDTVA
jgi:transposase